VTFQGADVTFVSTGSKQIKGR